MKCEKCAEIYIEKGIIRLKVPYDKELVKRIKEIKGYHWDLENKSWIFNKKDEVLHLIKKALATQNFDVRQYDNTHHNLSDLKTHLLYRSTVLEL